MHGSFIYALFSISKCLTITHKIVEEGALKVFEVIEGAHFLKHQEGWSRRVCSLHLWPSPTQDCVTSLWSTLALATWNTRPRSRTETGRRLWAAG